MVGTRIRELRVQKKLSISELAEKAGVSKSYISHIERNLQKNPSIQFLEKLALVLDVNVYTLLQPKEQAIDQEWIELIHEAIMLGVTKEEIHDLKTFIQFNKYKNTNLE